MGLAAVAVIGTNNNPLYVRAFGHDITRFHFIVHTALDFVEEKVQRLREMSAAGAFDCIGGAHQSSTAMVVSLGHCFFSPPKIS